jgi:hypothetical protein
MQTAFSTDHYVVARDQNVLLVDFRRPDPPAPKFPGAGALRRSEGTQGEGGGSFQGVTSVYGGRRERIVRGAGLC